MITSAIRLIGRQRSRNARLNYRRAMRLKVIGILVLASIAYAQDSAPPLDTATFDADGTAHLTRVVPMPTTISPEAQKWLASLPYKQSGPESLAARRARTDVWRKQDSAEARKLYPVNIEESAIAGVRTDLITPLIMPEAHRNRVL